MPPGIVHPLTSKLLLDNMLINVILYIKETFRTEKKKCAFLL